MYLSEFFFERMTTVMDFERSAKGLVKNELFSAFLLGIGLDYLSDII